MSGSSVHCRVIAPLLAILTAVLLLAAVRLGAQPVKEPSSPIRVGGGRAHAPFHFIDDHGQASGFDVELVTAVARAIGRDVELHLGHWQRARTDLHTGELDVLVGLTQSTERRRSFLFTAPTLTKSYRIITRSGDSKVLGEADLQDKEIIVQRAGPMERIARAHTEAVVLVDTGSQGLALLASGHHDCYLGANYRVLVLMRELGLGGLTRVGDPVLVAPYGLAVKIGREAFVEQLDRGLEIVRRSGEYDRIFQRWFIALEPGESKPSLVAVIASWVLLPMLGALVLSVAWLWTLRRQVVARTADLERELARRVEAETAYRESEEQFSKAFRFSPEPIVILSSADDRIIEVNEAFAQVTGYSRSELIGNKAADIGIWGDPEPMQQASERIEDSRPVLNLEMQLRHRSGDSRFCLCSMVRIQVGTQPCLLLVAADITERRRLESQLAQTSKMEALGQLAGGIAHDFNNLLSVIQGYCELTLLSLDEGSTEWQHVSTIQEAATRGSDLTRQMLAFSRQQKQHPVPIDLNTVVRNTKPMIRRLISERIVLRYLLRDDLGLVEVDPGQISQVIMNLVINARDAMAGGGTITLESSQRVLKKGDDSGGHHLLTRTPGRYAALEVRDTGHGIEGKALPHIFEPFFTTKAEGEGTGLGLATVYGIVKQSSGLIEVESTPGQGTTFRVLLPLVEEPGPEVESTHQATTELGGHETILLVEDEHQICKLIETTLADLGYRVLATKDPLRALQLMRTHDGRIDLLLTDVVMPGMDGVELASAIRKVSADTKVLFITGYTDDPELLDGVEKNDATLLAKPFTISALAHNVREILGPQSAKPLDDREPA